MPFATAAGAAVAGGLASGAVSVAGSLLQSGTASKASGQAQRNLQMILPQMQQNFVQQTGLYQPYAATGGQALGASADLLGLNGQPAADAAMGNFQTSPGYQWTVDQALRGVDAGAAAQGMLRSGATIKAEQDRASQLANQEFGNYYNRLAGLSGQGLTAASGIATAGNNLIAGEEGNAQSQNAALIGGANAQNSIYGNTASTLGNTVNSLFSNKDFQNWISPGGGSTFTPSPTGTYGGQSVYTGPTNTGAPTTYNF